MTKNSLPFYIFVSIIIHSGFLLGAHWYWKIPEEQVEQNILIPVEMVVTRELPPVQMPELSMNEQSSPKKLIETKGRKSLSAAIGPIFDDITDVNPVDIGDPPSLNFDSVAAQVSIPSARDEGKALSKSAHVSSKPIPLPHTLADESPSEPEPAMDEGNSVPHLAVNMIPNMGVMAVTQKIHPIPVEANSAKHQRASQAPPVWTAIQSGEDVITEFYSTPIEGENEPLVLGSTLQVECQPVGTQIYVDGTLSGETPLQIELPFGKHEVRLAFPDYYDWEAQIELTEEYPTFPINMRLLPME